MESRSCVRARTRRRASKKDRDEERARGTGCGDADLVQRSPGAVHVHGCVVRVVKVVELKEGLAGSDRIVLCVREAELEVGAAVAEEVELEQRAPVVAYV